MTTIDSLITSLQTEDFSNVGTILNNYTSDDWQKYINIDIENTGYVKTKLYNNDKIEVFIIIWYPNSSIDFHDHSANGCFMKILQGQLLENLISPIMTPITQHQLETGNVSYLCNSIGYHSLKNITNNIAVSINIYSPPNYNTQFINVNISS